MDGEGAREEIERVLRDLVDNARLLGSLAFRHGDVLDDVLRSNDTTAAGRCYGVLVGGEAFRQALSANLIDAYVNSQGKHEYPLLALKAMDRAALCASLRRALNEQPEAAGEWELRRLAELAKEADEETLTLIRDTAARSSDPDVLELVDDIDGGKI